jgi:hypothetical protein
LKYKYLLLPLLVVAVCSSLNVVLIQTASIQSWRAVYFSDPLSFVMLKKKPLRKRVGNKAYAEPYDEAPAPEPREEFVEPCEELLADSQPPNGLEVKQGLDRQAPEESRISSETVVQQPWTS